MSGSYPQYLIDALDASLALDSETVRLLRMAGAVVGMQVTCLATIRGYKPSEIVAGSGIGQQDQLMITSPTLLAAAGWPGLNLSAVPKQGDRVMSNRGVLTVQASVGLYVQDVLVRIEAQLRGQ
jgi:hypothetical protein